MDEFDSIDRLFRPLADNPEALGLLDDAALIPTRAGHELIVTTDAIVEGLHFLANDPPDLVARKLLRVNVSDLAAKAAEPYGYLLTVAWSPTWDEAKRTAFARGLGEDQARYRLKLFGGDTVSTPGPMMASVTLLGWVPTGRMVKRGGARVGDLLLVSGTIGDGYLGLKAAMGELELPQADLDYLAGRYRLPEPRLALRPALRRYATASADVSDGLLADAAHVGEASGLGVTVELEAMPTSTAASAQLNSGGRVELASGGDDYEVVCTARPENVEALIAAAREAGVPMTVIGRMSEGQGLAVTFNGKPMELGALGWRHG